MEMFGFDFWLALYAFDPDFPGQTKSGLNKTTTPQLARRRGTKLYQANMYLNRARHLTS